MATIPDLTQKPESPKEQPQEFVPRLEAEVQPQGVVLKMHTTPLNIAIQAVPNDLVAQIVPMWLEQHPELAMPIMKQVREAIKLKADIIHTVQATKNR